MLTSLSTFEKLLQSFQIRIDDAEFREPDQLVRLEKCIRICEESLQQLRQWVAENSFPDQDTEIYFFKRVKPRIMARYIYYYKRYRLHIGWFKGSALMEEERLNRERQEITHFLVENNTFYEYYRADSTHHDELFFVRGRYDWKLCPETNHFDEVFSTSGDGKLAECMAYELLLQYIEQLLTPVPAPDNNNVRAMTTTGLRCTASITSIVELAYALYVIGFFNHGKASIKEIMAFLSEVLKVDLRNYYHTFLQIRERKTCITKFLDELKARLLRYIEELGS